MARFRTITDKPDMQRRRFLSQMLALGAAMGLGRINRSYASTVTNLLTVQTTLSGNEFDLIVTEISVNFSGVERKAIAVNGSIPGPILRWREGETVTLRVTNHLPETTSIHWHGIILPFDMDGAPGISFDGIPSGETFTYQFKVQQSGTYWYHSHSGMQEQSGLYGAIIIDPAQESIQADREYVVQLSDWTDENPFAVFNKLKKQSDYYNYNQLTLLDFIRDVWHTGWSAAIDKRSMWNDMRMSMTDLSDISGHTYTYLLNGNAPHRPWTGIFKPGERVRLRMINSGAQSFFDLRIPGLQMTVVQADGQSVQPVIVDEIRLGVAETYDVIIIPTEQVYTLFAQSMDRTGYAYGMLATRPGLVANIPALDPPEPLSMLDMMGDMSGMSHAGMEHQHTESAVKVKHAHTEFSPAVDMHVDTPRTNLDDPGVGLRNNARKVLTYADLRSLGGVIDARQPDREIELHITGNMERYTWSFDGVEYADSTPVHFRHGERLRVIFINDTMMTHPLHLHGMWSDLESAAGLCQVRKHTISVQPAQRISFLVTADALGRWPWHCHLFYHMHAGMMREVIVT